MKRIKVVGLCLVAMFAFGAIAAAGAQAELEITTCAKVPKNKMTGKFEGVYTDKFCSIVSGTKEGKFAKQTFPEGATVSSKTKNSAVDKFDSAAGSIVCTKVKGSIEYIFKKAALSLRTCQRSASAR